VIFLVPVTFVIHYFWTAMYPAVAQTQQIHFLKRLSMLYAAVLIANFGSRPLSLNKKG
jgi:putative oxidoreductase